MCMIDYGSMFQLVTSSGARSQARIKECTTVGTVARSYRLRDYDDIRHSDSRPTGGLELQATGLSEHSLSQLAQDVESGTHATAATLQ